MTKRRHACLLAVALVCCAAARAADDASGYGLYIRPSLIITDSGTLSAAIAGGWSRPFEFINDRSSKGLHPNVDLVFTLDDGLSRAVLGLDGYFSTDNAGSWRTAWIYGVAVETEQHLNNPVFRGECGFEALVVPPWTGQGIGAARRSNAVLDVVLGTEFGYKTDTYTATTDTSSEAPDTMVWRLKGVADLQIRPASSWVPVVIEGRAGAWYDVRNDDFYHLLDFGIRANIGRYFWWDIYRYQNGWGAPTFNAGQQHNFGITWSF